MSPWLDTSGYSYRIDNIDTDDTYIRNTVLYGKKMVFVF
jgi:hypothetical protein